MPDDAVVYPPPVAGWMLADAARHGATMLRETPVAAAVRLADGRTLDADVVLAPGARERFVPFPGRTLPGVVGAGGPQALVKQGLDVAGKRVLIAGSGPLLLTVAELLVRKGASVPVVAEQPPLARLAAFAAGLLLEPAKLVQAAGIRRRIGGVVRVGTFVGQVDREGDALVAGPAGRERRTTIRCDMLACGFGLVPNLELARAIRCAIDRRTVVVDDLGRTMGPGVCRCEDVAAGRLRCLGSWREAKFLTRVGMGPCRGRVCGTATETLFGWAPDDVRPPLFPIPVGDLT